MCKTPHTCSLRMYSTAAMRKLALSVFSWLGIRSRSAWNLQGSIEIILQPTLMGHPAHAFSCALDSTSLRTAPDTSEGERAHMQIQERKARSN